MNVLVSCECSQEVCKSFRERGHLAFSSDLQPCYGGHPEWHIKGDTLELLNGLKWFQTMDGTFYYVEKWDLIIAHPPCTYLTVTGNRWFDTGKYGKDAWNRMLERNKAIAFFYRFVMADCPRIAIENPVGCMSTAYRPCDQTIQPWMFGHPTTKKTCLWLKGLPLLQPTNVVEVDPSDVYEYVAANGKIKHDSRSRCRCALKDRSNHRSKTFTGIAKAMAEQWG